MVFPGNILNDKTVICKRRSPIASLYNNYGSLSLRESQNIMQMEKQGNRKLILPMIDTIYIDI